MGSYTQDNQSQGKALPGYQSFHCHLVPSQQRHTSIQEERSSLRVYRSLASGAIRVSSNPLYAAGLSSTMRKKPQHTCGNEKMILWGPFSPCILQEFQGLNLVSKLGGRCLYPLSHLAEPEVPILNRISCSICSSLPQTKQDKTKKPPRPQQQQQQKNPMAFWKVRVSKCFENIKSSLLTGTQREKRAGLMPYSRSVEEQGLEVIALIPQSQLLVFWC